MTVQEESLLKEYAANAAGIFILALISSMGDVWISFKILLVCGVARSLYFLSEPLDKLMGRLSQVPGYAMIKGALALWIAIYFAFFKFSTF